LVNDFSRSHRHKRVDWQVTEHPVNQTCAILGILQAATLDNVIRDNMLCS